MKRIKLIVLGLLLVAMSIAPIAAHAVIPVSGI